MSVLMTEPRLIENALTRYYDEITATLTDAEGQRALGERGAFAPPFALPPLTPALRRYFGVSDVSFAPLGSYRRRTLWLLDLTANPGTRTTKTFGSLIIVARAVRHIQRTGERMLIITPSAANKATALRNAVLRAIDAGLVTPEQLQTAAVVPASAGPKLWSSPMADDPVLRMRNPVFRYDGPEREAVKPLTQEALGLISEDLWHEHQIRVWPTLHVDNYKVADVVRAFAERDALGQGPPTGRTHVHAVSSAYGLLGHDLGHRRLEAMGAPPEVRRYLFVQHLETPDVVQMLQFGRVDEADLPSYRYEPASGLYEQDETPHFPAATLAPVERLEPTFYTRLPPTLPQIRELAERCGGTGLVVSLHECLVRYAETRAMLGAPRAELLPADPRQLREWALAMALVGAVIAIDRGLVPEGEVIVHGSGAYSEQQFDPLPATVYQPIENAAELAAGLFNVTAPSQALAGVR